MHAAPFASVIAGSLAFVFATPVFAAPQQTDPPALHRDAHGFAGNGPNYRAHFGKSGFSFVPLQRSASQEHSLGFRLLSVGRRSTGAGSSIGDVAPTADNRTVRYVRSSFVETYEVRADGVEQSFVFASLPPGSGDLLVSGRIDTEMTLVDANAKGLRFEASDGHGVSFGAVLGIDARGVTANGTLRVVGGVIEMSLPASFVDAAELPLVLDPLVGSITPVAPGHSPAVAYSVVADHYLAAWENDGTPATVSGALIQNDGTVLSPFAIAPTPPFTHASLPRVASVQAGFTAFGVAHLGGPTAAIVSTLVTGVDSTGNVIGTANVGNLSDTHAGPDIAGDVIGGEDDVLVVFENVTQGVIQVAEFELDTLLTMQVINLTTTATTDSNPAISASGGPTGRYLVTWERSAGSHADLWGAVIDRNLSVLVSAFPIATTTTDEQDPDVDGDGTNWIVAFEREGTAGSNRNNIYCYGVAYDAGSNSAYLSTGARPVETDINDEHDVAVAWTGESYLIGFSDEFGLGDWDLYAKSRETLACRSCEGQLTVATSAFAEDQIAIASQLSGGRPGDEAMILWAVLPGAGAATSVQAHRFQATDGQVVDLGGACAGGGSSRASCALEGVTQFGLGVQHATAGVPAALLLGAAPISAPCGPCTLVLNPVVSVPAVTDGNGNAALSFALTGAFQGATLISQWAILTPGGGCVVPFSNGLAVTIQ